MPKISLGNYNNRFDLNRHIQGQRAHSDGATRIASNRSEQPLMTFEGHQPVEDLACASDLSARLAGTVVRRRPHT